MAAKTRQASLIKAWVEGLYHEDDDAGNDDYDDDDNDDDDDYEELEEVTSLSRKHRLALGANWGLGWDDDDEDDDNADFGPQ